MKGHTVLDIYEEALGVRPSQLVSTAKLLGEPELVALLDVRARVSEGHRTPESPAPSEIWPLMSHHTYGNRALFGGNRRDILPRALALLLIHDGLTIADPLETVHRTLANTTKEAAIGVLNDATSELAQVEGLIAAGILRLTSARPSLHEKNRRATLAAFGVTPDLRVFTDFLEAAGGVPDVPGSLDQLFAPQVQELYRRFGMSISKPLDLPTAERSIRDLAAAIIEVSWQLAVVADDHSCDLAVMGPLERHLVRELVAAGLGQSAGPGRHLETVELGLVPNLDPHRLTLADAVAVRRDDSFASFRATVRRALDELETARRTGGDRSSGIAVFEEAMQEASRRLRTHARRSSFKDRVADAAIPASLGVVTELAVAPLGAAAAAGAAGGISVATVLWQWLLGRQESRRQGAHLRYLSMLGNAGE